MPRRRAVRGVYRLKCLSVEGFPIYVAVTRDGRRVAERVCYPFENADVVMDELRTLLDQHDSAIPEAA